MSSEDFQNTWELISDFFARFYWHLNRIKPLEMRSSTFKSFKETGVTFIFLMWISAVRSLKYVIRTKYSSFRILDLDSDVTFPIKQTVYTDDCQNTFTKEIVYRPRRSLFGKEIPSLWIQLGVFLVLMKFKLLCFITALGSEFESGREGRTLTLWTLRAGYALCGWWLAKILPETLFNVSLNRFLSHFLFFICGSRT